MSAGPIQEAVPGEAPPLRGAEGSWSSGECYFDPAPVRHWIGRGTGDWHQDVVEAIRGVFDPEIPVNIYDLGLVYQVETLAEGVVKVQMTLTSPACPEADSIPGRVEANLRELPDTREVVVDIVWDPPWTPDERMSEATRLDLGFY